ncbi:MAG: phosphoribosylglycinamide formyltransferase [Alphaproteobacteria bacterium]
MVVEKIKKANVAILISGRGSNMEALIRASKDPRYPAKIALVISNKNNAAGIEIAKKYKIKTAIILKEQYNSRIDYDRALSSNLLNENIEYICAAGFMRILSEEFIDQWWNKIINIHPSLLPSYKGLNTHQRVLDDRTKVTGCSVHIVRKELDNGPIIIQAAVPVEENDTEEILSKRVLKMEHKIYPYSLMLLTSKKITINNDIVKYDDKSSLDNFLLSL